VLASSKPEAVARSRGAAAAGAAVGGAAPPPPGALPQQQPSPPPLLPPLTPPRPPVVIDVGAFADRRARATLGGAGVACELTWHLICCAMDGAHTLPSRAPRRAAPRPHTHTRACTHRFQRAAGKILHRMRDNVAFTATLVREAVFGGDESGRKRP
jgi:hypothetical protein